MSEAGSEDRSLGEDGEGAGGEGGEGGVGRLLEEIVEGGDSVHLDPTTILVRALRTAVIFSRPPVRGSNLVSLSLKNNALNL